MELVVANVEAVAAAVRMSYGPCGRDQLVVTETQKLVTNSAARILSLARPGSPIAKVLLQHVCKFAEEIGDGAATLALLLDGAFQFCASAMKDGKASQQDLGRCFQLAEVLILPDAMELLHKLRPKEGLSTELAFTNLARTLFGANFPLEVSSHLSKTCWQWLKANSVSEEPSEKVANTARRLRSGKLIKVPTLCPTGFVADGRSCATVENKHIISAVLAHSAMPCEVFGGRVAILDENTAPLPVRVAMPGKELARLKEHLLLTTEQLWQAGIRVVLCVSQVHEEWTGSLARRGICLLNLVDEEELNLLESRVGPVRRILPGSHVALLAAATFPIESMRPLRPSGAGSRAYWLIKPQEERSICLLLLQSPSSSLAAEHRLAVLRLLAVVAPALEDPSSIIAGGLTFELALLRLAHERALSLRGRNRPSTEVFGPDFTKASHLELLTWSLLEASLTAVIEAFLANLGSDGLSSSVSRTVRLLATAPETELPGLVNLGRKGAMLTLRSYIAGFLFGRLDTARLMDAVPFT
ncbi:unnamed protein product [Durusdinium trenchii]|uniref:Uncharacterized protein n=1 Tax=Durusdinium trenchii TaxID=1381693 RepID=A0ABP0I5H7_9DINO